MLQDLRFAVRTLCRCPSFSLVALVILALGIGANTAIFSLFSAVLLKPLPLEEPDELVSLWSDLTKAGGPERLQPPLASYVDWRTRSTSFDDVAALEVLSYNLTGDGTPERLAGIRTTANLFSLIGLQPILGRTLTPADEGPDATPVVVIDAGLWARRFGADPSIVGRTMVLDGLAHTVIGIVPPDFQYPSGDTEIWVPALFSASELARRDAYVMHVVARLKEGVTLAQAQVEMNALAQTLEREFPQTNTNTGIAVAALQEHMTREARRSLFILLATVGIILLITCANLANLLLARGAERQREFALRQAIGAGFGRLMRQSLTESTLLAAIGIAIGLVLSTLSFNYLAQLIPGTFPRSASPLLDWRVLLFSIAITVVTVALFGLGPALAAARIDCNETLKSGAGRVGAATSARLRNVLVVAEMTLTVVLLVAAGLLLRSYSAVLATDPGFEPRGLLLAETVLSPTDYAAHSERVRFTTEVLRRLKSVPGVRNASFTNYPPLIFKGGRITIAIEGRPAPTPENFIRFITSGRSVSADYFTTLGVPLLRGRVFDERDDANAPGTVVINQALADLHWPGQDPLGQRFQLGRPDEDAPWFTIVGVVGDMRQMGLDVPPEAEMYFSIDQAHNAIRFYWPRHLVIRTDGDPLSLAAAVQGAVWSVDPSQPVSNLRSMSDVFNAELANRDTQLTLIGGFAGLALVLAAVGLYGVLSYSVAQRRSEMGLRMALGAQRDTILSDVIKRAVILAAIGALLGLGGALALTRFLSAFLYDISAADPATFAAVSLVLVIVAVVASYLPARQAARIDPMQALRTD